MIVDTILTVHISLGADSSQMKLLWSENMKMAHARKLKEPLMYV